MDDAQVQSHAGNIRTQLTSLRNQVNSGTVDPNALNAAIDQISATLDQMSNQNQTAGTVQPTGPDTSGAVVQNAVGAEQPAPGTNTGGVPQPGQPVVQPTNTQTPQ